MTKVGPLSHAEDSVPRYEVSHWVWSWLVSLSPSNPLVSAPTMPHVAFYEDSGIWSRPQITQQVISPLLPSQGWVMREEWTHLCTFSRVLTNTQRSLPSGFLCVLSLRHQAWVGAWNWEMHTLALSFRSLCSLLGMEPQEHIGVQHCCSSRVATHQNPPATPTQVWIQPAFNLISSVLHPFSRIQK